MSEIEQFLQVCVDRNASDLHLIVEKPPVLRLDGALESLDLNPLTSEDTEALMRAITSNEHQEILREKGGVDFGFAFGDAARFRVSVYKQKGAFALSLRLIPSRLMTFEEIGLPPCTKGLLHKDRGLILITGPTGSGKTTTLATMLDYINLERDAHIVTIEDPIEYYHTHKKGIVSQRELGVDVPSFADGLEKGLRSDPDVFLIGEMRDLATIGAAIRAAETGHLVMATLHTVSAAQTVDRIIDVFPPHQQEQIRVQLSTSILAVFCQQLLRRASGKGRIAAFEVMVATSSISNLIREKKTYNITSDIQTGGKYEMKTFDASLFELYSEELVNYEDAVSKAFAPDEMQTKIEAYEKTKKRRR